LRTPPTSTLFPSTTLFRSYKQLATSTAEASAPEFTGTRPAVHADHIGASTFIEKGWSLISLGDHVGAIQAPMWAAWTAGRVPVKDRKSTRLNSSHVATSYA